MKYVFVCLFWTKDIDSTPPATITDAPSAIMFCAAIAIACKPDEQCLLTVSPETFVDSPALKAACLAILFPVVPCGLPQPITTSSTSLVSMPLLLIACWIAWPANEAP